MYVYIFLVVLLFIAANIYFYYLVAKDSPETRALVPWALLAAGIVSFLIVFWIIYYICAMYPGDKVKIVKYSRGDSEDDDEDSYDEDTAKPKKKYAKQSKGNYILTHILSPLINGLLYLLFFCIARDWVKRHENQQRAYG